MIEVEEGPIALIAARGPVMLFTTIDGSRAAIVIDYLRDVGDAACDLGCGWDEIIALAWSLGFSPSGDEPDYECQDDTFVVYVLEDVPVDPEVVIDLRAIFAATAEAVAGAAACVVVSGTINENFGGWTIIG